MALGGHEARLGQGIKREGKSKTHTHRVGEGPHDLHDQGLDQALRAVVGVGPSERKTGVAVKGGVFVAVVVTVIRTFDLDTKPAVETAAQGVSQIDESEDQQKSTGDPHPQVIEPSRQCEPLAKEQEGCQKHHQAVTQCKLKPRQS